MAPKHARQLVVTVGSSGRPTAVMRAPSSPMPNGKRQCSSRYLGDRRRASSPAAAVRRSAETVFRLLLGVVQPFPRLVASASARPRLYAQCTAVTKIASSVRLFVMDSRLNR